MPTNQKPSELRRRLRVVEAQIILQELIANGGVIRRAAKALGIGENVMRAKIKDYNIDLGAVRNECQDF